MKQIELAKELGVSKSYLSMILSGQRKPNAELANKLRRYSGKLVHKKTVNFEAKNSLRGRCPKPLDECAVVIIPHHSHHQQANLAAGQLA